MRIDDAVALLGGRQLRTSGPTRWADLGCGTGTFTRALARILAPGSTIFAMDSDQAALARVPAREADVTIEKVTGDFTALPWRFAPVDGILMANALHYVADQATFLHRCLSQATARWRLVIVEYDTTRASSWVPYPIDRSRLGELFPAESGISLTPLGSRHSRYQRGGLYAFMATAMPSAEA